jgi:hypothetical protein
MGRKLIMKLNIPIKITGRGYLELRNVKTGKVIREYFKNMFVTAGKNSIADALRGTDNKGIVTYCAVGTDATAPALGNTQLGSELARKLISVKEVDGNTAVFSTYFTTSEAIGALKEAGLFGDAASATPDTGTLFCHAAINKTKTSSDTLTIVWYVSIG